MQFSIMQTICMKCQILLSGKSKKNVINLSSAKMFAYRVVVQVRSMNRMNAMKQN